MQLIFAFTFNPETKEAAFTGNIDPAMALKILQDIVIADALAKAEAERIKKTKAEKKVKEKE